MEFLLVEEDKKKDNYLGGDTNPTSSNKLNENDTTNTITLYRVGDPNRGTFFTDSLDYYDHSMTGYKKNDAKAYKVDLSNAKVFDPIKQFGWDVCSWSTIEGKIEDFEKYDIWYDSTDEEGIWGWTDTDALAHAFQNSDYDMLILSDIRGDNGWGPPFNEYVVYNTDILTPVKNDMNESKNELKESLHNLGGDCFITDSPYTMRDILTNKPKAYRILYDANIDSYMFCDASEYIHWDLLIKAYKSGYYADIENNSDIDPVVLEYIKDGSLSNYADLGNDGYYWDDDDEYVEFGQYLLYGIWIPKGTNEDDVANSPSSDGYDGKLTLKGGTLHIRDASQELMDNCDLIRILQKQSWANESLNLNESFQQDLLSFIYENAPLQKEPYWWSTFILPDGRFVNILELDGEDCGEHEDFYGWLYDSGYDVYEQDIVDGIGCIKLNVTYPYASCPSSRPTTKQLRALEEWLEDITSQSDFEIRACEDGIRGMTYPVSIRTNDYKIYDLNVTSPSDIIKAIQKSYSSGMLESRNELKENMDITNEVQRAVDNVMKNKSKYRNQDDLESAIYSAVANCFSGMHGVTRDTADMIADVYEKELERVGLNTMNETVDISKFNFTNYRNPDGQSHPNCKTYRSTLEYMASETERLFKIALHTYWGETEPYKQLTSSYMNLNRHSCTRDLVGAGAEQGLKDAQSAIFKRQGELLELSKQFTKWNGKEWVKVPNQHNKPLGEGIYSYQTYIRTGERGKPIYTLSYGQSTIIARYDKNSYMITFGTDWEHHISHLIEWLKEYYPNFFVKQVDGSFVGFIPTEEEAVQYIKNEIRRGKALTESNELEQRAKKHKKKSKGMGWHMSMNAGDVEKGIEVFNNSTSLGSSGSGEGAAMGEAVEKQLYYYNGPIYYRGHKISISSDIYTTAKSFEEAARNILFKAANGDELRYFDIVDDKIKQMPKGKLERPKCHTCGYELNDMGDCPVCDYGEDDLLESLSSLEALWELNRLD